MRNILALWTVVAILLVASWIALGQNTPASNPFHGSIVASGSAPAGSLFLDSTGAIYTGSAAESLGLFEISQGNGWIGVNITPNAGAFKYKANGAAQVVQFSNGNILFRTFVTGTAGATATPLTGISLANGAPNNSIAVSATGGITFSQIKAASGKNYLCVDTSGVVTASATACN